MSSWIRRDYVGRQYADDGVGPHAFSCWGLVRHVFKARLGIELPAIALNRDAPACPGNVAAIKQAARVAGMRPLDNLIEPVEMDVLLLSAATTLHCGVIVVANKRLCLLHANHVDGVVCEPWRFAVGGMQVQLWRRSA